MKCKLWISLLCIVLSTGIASGKHRVYIVNSYNPDTFSWTREINDGIVKGFTQYGLTQGADYEIVTDHMDALVKSSEEQMKAEGERITADIKAKKPDIIITTDDDALAFVGLNFTDIPVVFSGVNGDPAKYLHAEQLDSIEKPGHNITGVYQMTYFKQSLNLVKMINSNATGFAVVTDESTTSHAILQGLETVKSELPLELKDVFRSRDFSAWKTKVAELQNKVDAIFFISFNSVQENGKMVSIADAGEWIQNNNQIPVFSCWGYQVQSGVLLSAADDGGQQGLYAAKHVVGILEGTDPGSLAIVCPPNGVPVLNAKTAQAMGLSLPEDVLSLFIENGVIYK
ncbi:ABC transporter substrate-binding protein [Planctomycetota bacterium]